MKIFLQFALAMALASTAFAAGGTCPSGANYLNSTAPSGSLVTLSSLGVSSCFYIAADGSDSNNGTSESTPWLHAPGMSRCSNTCESATPTGGEGFIFRGGDTWHEGNSSDTTYTGGDIEWAWSGTSQSVPIYLGVDQTWYSGGSWTRPIINADNPLSTTTVSSCSYPATNNGNMLDTGDSEWLIVDNFEFTGMCWNSSDSSSTGMIGFYGPVQSATGQPYFIVVENNYCHGWTLTTGATEEYGYAISGNQSYPGAVTQFNVIDGSDSDSDSLISVGSLSGGSDLYILRFNVITHTAGDVISSSCHIIDDNLFEYHNSPTDGSGHGDIPFCQGEYAGGSSDPNLWYNNVWNYIGETNADSYLPDIGTPSGQTDYIFNNIWHDNQPDDEGDYVTDEDRSGNWVIFNNTAEVVPGSSREIFMTASGSFITAINNHWVSPNADQADIFESAPASETEAVYMTNTNATTQGYTSSNNYAPTASSNSTVTASGTNETTGYCADSVLHNAAAEAACKEGITGVSENTTTHTVVYPAVTAVARPSTGAWNVGAYQYLPGSITPATLSSGTIVGTIQ
jgi:hypothetical protein